jgi:hypothetical protein
MVDTFPEKVDTAMKNTAVVCLSGWRREASEERLGCKVRD